MARYYIGCAVLVFSLSFFSSCSSNYLKACYENLSAIHLFEKGEVDRAITVFAKASDNIDKNEYKKYIEYNIASLYREIGELDAAKAKFLSINADNDDELRYRIYFELGIIAFQNSLYEEAAVLFKNAILINNNDIKLIRNLELALLLMDEDEKKREESEEYLVQPDDDKTAEDTERLLNIMFSGENLFWIEDTVRKPERGKDW